MIVPLNFKSIFHSAKLRIIIHFTIIFRILSGNNESIPQLYFVMPDFICNFTSTLEYLSGNLHTIPMTPDSKSSILIHLCITLCLLTLCPNTLSLLAATSSSAIPPQWEEGRSALKSAEYQTAIEIGNQLENSDSDIDKMCGEILLMQAYVMLGNPQQARIHLRHMELDASPSIPDSIMCSFYNGKGLYAINVENDNCLALDNYYKAYQTAKRARHKNMEAIALNNIVSIQYLRKDPEGLEFAKESLQISREIGDPALILGAASQYANMLVMTGQPTEAIPFCDIIEETANEKLPLHKDEAFLSIGDIWLANGNPDKALQYFNDALRFLNPQNRDAEARIYLGISKAYLAKKNPNEAKRWLDKAEKVAAAGGTPVFANDVSLFRVSLLEQTGDFQGALNRFRQLMLQRDSLFSLEKEHDLHEVRARFDLERHENQLAQQNIDLLKKQRVIYGLILIMLFIIIGAFFTYRMYRRKNALYESIVRQNTISINKEKALNEKIEELQRQLEQKESLPAQKNDEPQKYRTSSLNEELHAEIIRKIEKAMNVDKVYKTKNFTSEALAAIIGSNRTYLSQVVNEEYNMTFTQYVNSYRVREAIRLLSDPSYDLPLKNLCTELGFSSPSTFNTVFRNATGMTPSAYRNVALRQSAEPTKTSLSNN